MKRIFLISLSLALIGMGSYYVWKYYHPKLTHAWDLVPTDALAVYEHNKSASETTARLIQLLLSDSIATSPLPNEFLISFHRTAKGVAGSVFYITGQPADKIASRLRARKGAKARIFEGVQIMEIPAVKKKQLSGFSLDNVLVLSASPLLIEDVIRTVKAEEPKNFAGHNKSLFGFSKMEWNDGRIYFNLEELPTLLDVFALDANPTSFAGFFAGSGVADLKFEKEIGTISGFIQDSLAKGPSVLSLFSHQRPVSVNLPKIISSRSGWLAHYGVSDPIAWAKDHTEFKKNHRISDDSLDVVLKAKGFNREAFYSGLGKEWGNVQAGIFEGHIFVAQLSTDKPESELLKTSEVSPPEPYSHYEIRSLNESKLPLDLFWPLCTRPMKYWSTIDHHVVFAEFLEDLKAFVDDADSDNTWGKSSEWNKFLSSTQETNVGLIFDAINAWPALRSKLMPAWQSMGDSTRLFGLDKGSIQITRLERTYSLNGTFQLEPGSIKSKPEQNEKITETTLTKALLSSLTVVKNHNNGSDELLGQDGDNNLLLFSSALKQLFKTQLDGPIKTSITQIDVYKNKKLQYLFATENSIYLIDRNGTAVRGFPFPLPGTKPIQFLTVVDLNNSRDYSLLVTDTDGGIGRYGVGGGNVSDWKPVKVSELQVAPQFVRLDGKDQLIALSKEGVLYSFSTHGTNNPGFPVDLKIRPSGNWTFEKSNGASLLTVVGDDGTLVKIDSKGALVSRTNLIKTSPASRFTLVPAAASDEYIISRVDRGKLSVVTATGGVLFEVENPGSEDMYASYFEVEQNKKVVAFSDPQQEFTYYFTSRGEPIFSRPLENTRRPAIISEKSGVYFYCVLPEKIQRFKRSRIR